MEHQMKFPDIAVRLTGEDGNIFNLTGRVMRAMRAADVSKADRETFGREVTGAQSYDEALRVLMRWVEVS